MTIKGATMDISKLKPGDNHYMAYVGPPAQYDFMGGTQFRLLSTLGLRANHSLLDFGCGSLRAGRLFLSYLVGPEKVMQEIQSPCFSTHCLIF